MSRQGRFLRSLALLCVLLVTASLSAACSGVKTKTGPAGDGQSLKILATTSIVADVVQQAGGDVFSVETLLPTGVDPHEFNPAPQDLAKVADADLIFANGAGLETFLDPLLQSAGGSAKVVKVSDGVQLLNLREESQGTGTPAGPAVTENVQGYDPHVWTDPNNVITWTDNIAKALAELDPGHKDTYDRNAAQYKQKLQELDAWIRDQVAQVPEANRKIVTDHLVFGYFAKEYGFQQIGAIVPAFSTMAEPPPQDLAKLEDQIRALNVKAVFVGNTANPNLAQRVAEDTGAKLVYLYTGSLSPPGGEAGTYIDFMHYDVNAIVSALK